MSAQSSAALSGISLVPTPPTVEPEVRTAMRVRKRNGSFEPVDVNKIVRAIPSMQLKEILRSKNFNCHVCF